MSKIDSMDLVNKTRSADAKMAEGQKELSDVRRIVNENWKDLAHEASTDYLTKLNQDLQEAIAKDDTEKAKSILDTIALHKKSIRDMREYVVKVQADTGGYIDNSTGVANMENFEKELNAFMAETFVIWYGKADADKAKISMQATPLSKMDYEKLRKTDTSLYGQYTINPETAGMNHKEKEPRVKILDMKEFIGKPRSEVMKAVVEKYGGQYHIPGLEYEKYLLENPDKVPEQLKDGNYYCFAGSTLRDRYGNSSVPYVRWYGSKFYRDADWLVNLWGENDRVALLEK